MLALHSQRAGKQLAVSQLPYAVLRRRWLCQRGVLGEVGGGVGDDDGGFDGVGVATATATRTRRKATATAFVGPGTGIGVGDGHSGGSVGVDGGS